jgi:hypothetical protein
MNGKQSQYSQIPEYAITTMLCFWKLGIRAKLIPVVDPATVMHQGVRYIPPITSLRNLTNCS